jgi:hypothetical protein
VLATGAVLVGYFTVSWATSGRTLGDKIMGLRVVNFRGERLRWVGSFLRAVFCTVLPIGLFWILVSPSNRTVQDTVMRTSCIYDWIDRPFRGAAPLERPPTSDRGLTLLTRLTAPGESSYRPCCAALPPLLPELPPLLSLSRPAAASPDKSGVTRRRSRVTQRRHARQQRR